MRSEPVDEKAAYNIARRIASPEARAEYLEQVCGDDPGVMQRVVELLRVHDEEQSFLEAPPLAVGASLTLDQAITEKPGTTIGRYKLREQIGEGGFGVVFMAEQQEPVRRMVALKIIKPGMDTKEVIARFEAERQALALMDHPKIAKVLDAGATESGRPYFVMELVRGVPITEYCDTCNLPNEQRLELFVEASEAVQHAHQKGIIHRDIKPSNVLIAIQDGHPQPKIIDFGVAKATNQRLTEQTVLTGFAQMVGTPLYMSPEQAEMTALDVDTRADVYSLGVLLYELITGTTPFEKERLKQANYDELRRIIREEEPAKPSHRISTLQQAASTIAEHRRTDPKRLRQSVRGDLDWIAMRALEKDRTQRYETVNAFAADVRRYLNDEPVEACPPSAAYRFKKFARRNKGVLLAVTCVAIALLIGTAVSTSLAIRATRAERAEATERQKAERERENAVLQERHAKDNLALARKQEQQAKDNLTLAKSQQARAEGNLDLALKALDAVYLDAIGRDKLLGEPIAEPDDDEIEWPDSNTQPPLTDLERELLSRGLKFYDRFAKQNAATPRVFVQTAQAYYRVALLQAGLGETEDAAASYEAAIERFEQLTKDDPENAEHFRRLAEAYKGLARVVPDWAQAKKDFHSAKAAYSKAIELKPNDVSLYLRRGAVRNALSDLRAVEDYERALQFDLNNVQGHLQCSSYYQWGPVVSRNREKAREHAERAAALAPNNPHAHLRLADVLGWTDGYPVRTGIGAVVLSVPDSKPALQHFARAIQLAPDMPDVYAARGKFLNLIGEYGPALDDFNRALELKPNDTALLRLQAEVLTASDQTEKALAKLDVLLRLHPNDSGLHRQVGTVHLQRADWQAAVDAFTRAVEINSNWVAYKRRAVAYIKLTEYERALADLKTALKLNARDTSTLWWALPSDLHESPEDFRTGLLALAQDAVKWSPVPAVAYADRGLLYVRLKEYENAESDLAKAVEIDPNCAHAWLQWGQSYSARGLQQEAREKFSKAIEANPGRWMPWARRGKANFRLGDFAAAVEDYSKVLELYPSHRSSLLMRCVAQLRLGHLDQARDDLAALRESKGRGYDDHYHSALLSLALHDEAQFRESCRTMLDALAETEDPMAANFAAWTCSLVPDAVDDYQRAIALATKAVEAEPESDQFLNTLGSILFRAGRRDEAIEQLTELDRRLENPDHEAQTCSAYTWYFLAMAHKRADYDGQAREYLNKANQWTDEVLADREHSVAWNRQATLEILRKEAEAIVRTDDQRPPDSDQKPQTESNTNRANKERD